MSELINNKLKFRVKFYKDSKEIDISTIGMSGVLTMNH